MLDINEEVNEIKALVGQAERFAMALRRVGLNASELFDICAQLKNTAEFIKKESNKDFDEQFKQAQQNSANVINACLAGVKLKEKENKA